MTNLLFDQRPGGTVTCAKTSPGSASIGRRSETPSTTDCSLRCRIA
jgi:hypothetical protein